MHQQPGSRDMHLNAIHHVSINVKNVEEAEKFYVGILGLETLFRPDLGFPGLWLQVGGQQIHLLGIDSGNPVKEQHFAFQVDDLAAIRKELEAAGVTLSDTNEIKGICMQAFAHDPSGNLLEFNQALHPEVDAGKED